MEEESGKIRITAEDLERIVLPQADQSADQPRAYGNLAAPPADPPPAERGGSALMKAWCYLGLAGLAGALIAWAVCEPWFVDGRGGGHWANRALIPLMVVLTCVAFGMAEGIVERSSRKALLQGLLSVGLGTGLGFVFSQIANLIFTIGLGILAQFGALNYNRPGFWITRAIAWVVFGVACGIVYGIAGQSGKKCLYGIAGGVIGAGLGGLLFDPISIAAGGAAASRAVGLALFGAATGVAMGLVESALKDRWLYVAAGPLAGKQFILYKPLTSIGSNQASDIYLFKDPAVLPQHASIEMQGPRAVLRSMGPVSVEGRMTREVVLHSGDTIQIGRYKFSYRDRERVTR